MRVLITGAGGFIGKNLGVRLSELPDWSVIPFVRDTPAESFPDLLEGADAVVHLAGENRPKDVADFRRVNAELTEALCQAIEASGRQIPIILASSTQAALSNPYGESKRAAELAVEGLAKRTGNPARIYRLPGVFGKWCRPNYNSVVATFCHNIANDLPIQINDPAAVIKLVYVDDVLDEFIDALGDLSGLGGDTVDVNGCVEPEHTISLGDLANQIQAFGNCREDLIVERVGAGLVRALYSTYVSYLPLAKFSYELPKYGDERGVFVEFLKTQDSGQFSFFTAHPGITRGEHYHHSKTEKFLVIKGKARFGFRNVLTHETFEIDTEGDVPRVVETIPGWAHDITNVGDDEMVVMLWANENFDRSRPDTIACKVQNEQA